MDTKQYICCAGGGTKGTMYVGMISAFYDHFCRVSNRNFSEYLSDIKGFAGTSIGALASMVLMLKLQPHQIEDLIAPQLASMRNVVPRPDIAMLLSEFGLDDGKALRQVITNTLRAGGICEDATFEDIRRLLKSTFACISTNIHTSKPVVFSADTTPNMPIADAVFMSMCLPFVWTPLRYNDQIHIDGGLTTNMPDVFPRDETLFIAFDDPHKTAPVNTLNEYIVAVFQMAVDTNRWFEDYTCLLCRLPSIAPTDSLDFDISPCVSQTRIVCGYASALMFLYPSFLPTIVSTLEMMYQVALDQQTCMFEDY